MHTQMTLELERNTRVRFSRSIRPHHAHKHHLVALNFPLQKKETTVTASERNHFSCIGSVCVEILHGNLRMRVGGRDAEIGGEMSEHGKTWS